MIQITEKAAQHCDNYGISALLYVTPRSDMLFKKPRIRFIVHKMTTSMSKELSCKNYRMYIL